MTAQDKELDQLHDDIVDDVKDLLDKYMSIVSWDVPENNEINAKIKILEIMEQTIGDLKQEK